MTKKKILIVEDEVIVAKNTEMMLKDLDYEVIGSVGSGKKAIELAPSLYPDLILMDIVLDDSIDGIQAAEEILKEIEIPIIFTTSYSDAKILKRAKEVAPYGYIIKPFQKKELFAGIEIALERYALVQRTRENERLLDTTLQSISDGIITTNTDGKIIFLNKTAENLTGWTLDKAFNVPLEEVFRLSDEDKKAQNFYTKPTHLTTISRFEKPLTLIHKYGAKKVIDGSIAPINDATGKNEGTVLAFRDITDVERAHRIQQTMYNISNAVNTTINLHELFSSIQKYLGEIIDTKNFYIALYDKETDTISLPFIVDDEDEFHSFPAGKTLTAYVIRNDHPILVTEEKNLEMTKQGLIETIGSPSKVWMGVPLKKEKEVIGVVAVQSYEDEKLYTEEDLGILEFVSGQIAIAISHKRAEDAQNIERAYFEQLFKNAPEAIVLIDNESRILRMNEQFTKVFGYTIEEARGKKIDKLLTHGEYGKQARAVTERIAQGETVALESIRWHKNGTQVHVSILGTPITFEGGQIAVYGIYRDISDKKKAEEDLKKSEERYRELVENATDIIYRMDTEGIITYVNAVGEKLFGKPANEIIGKMTLDIVDAKGKNNLKRYFQRQFLQKKPNTYHEFKITTKKGEKRWLGQNTSLLFDGENIIGFQAVARDITERKNAEDALKQKTDDLNQRVKELNCLYGISDLVEDPVASLETILQESLNIISKAWRYPDITYVRILWGEKEFKTDNFTDNDWFIGQNILAYNSVIGTIQVGYLEEKPKLKNGPFSYEETNLLHAISDQLGTIAERKLAEEETRQFKTISDNANLGIATIDFNSKILYVNEYYAKTHGYKISDILGSHISVFFNDKQFALFNKYKNMIIKERRIEAFETWHRRKDGYIFPMLTNGIVMETEQDKIKYIALSGIDITDRKKADNELKEAYKKLELLARTDPLTQLSNRRDAVEKIEYEVSRFERNNKNFSIIIADVDDFKDVNDHYGHDAGDYVLRTLANIMRMIVRKQDLVARWGGEEFLLMLPQTNLEGAVILANKIRDRILKTNFTYQNQKIDITLTKGVSMFRENISAEEAINLADKALYLGKKTGKNKVVSEKEINEKKS